MRDTKTLVSLGDCAVTGNVPAMRNSWTTDSIFKRVYWDNAATQQQIPIQGVPKLLARARPVHEVVKVDVFVPGCPPAADTIHTVLVELLAGRTPDVASLTRFGA